MARLLITAGPTREPLDPVRFLSNRSTGAMGFALAEEALARRHEAILVLGPVAAQPPVGAEVYGVETADEMLDAALEFLRGADAVLCAAAVADYRPATRSDRKLKRGEMRSIELVENPDVAAAIGRERGDRPCAIFALETGNGVDRARGKLERKNADFCVLNSPDAIGADEEEFTLVRRDGDVVAWGRITKREVATRLLDEMRL